ncbi:hypothetical protein BC828DRAFT_168713 [Blastocladiella britannica]|nr:hypothetical protein BC828DRAFT_168713 [Blastocladiella britannica]
MRRPLAQNGAAQRRQSPGWPGKGKESLAERQGALEPPAQSLPGAHPPDPPRRTLAVAGATWSGARWARPTRREPRQEPRDPRRMLRRDHLRLAWMEHFPLQPNQWESRSASPPMPAPAARNHHSTRPQQVCKQGHEASGGGHHQVLDEFEDECGHLE